MISRTSWASVGVSVGFGLSRVSGKAQLMTAAAINTLPVYGLCILRAHRLLQLSRTTKPRRLIHHFQPWSAIGLQLSQQLSARSRTSSSSAAYPR
jgi:hypothetical protein